VRRLPERRDGRPLRPLTPIFGPPKKTGSLAVGNTPATAVTVFFDDFNRADGDIGANYTAGNTDPLPEIVSNACQCAGTDPDYYATLNQAVPDNLTVSGLVTHGVGGDSGIALFARWDGTDGVGNYDAYVAVWTQGGAVELYVLEAFQSTVLLDSSTGHGNGASTSFALICNGTTISVEVGGTQILSATDATHTAGQVGFAMTTSLAGSVIFDDFTVTVP
jgi:hypothetical protein